MVNVNFCRKTIFFAAKRDIDPRTVGDLEFEMPEIKTALGAYLFTKRMERDGDNLSEYLAKYMSKDEEKAFSESYYRDLEAGRREIRVQSGKRLCEILDLEEKAFYYFLLKDALPKSAFDQLISPAAVETYTSATERIQQLEARLADSAKVLLEHVTDDICELSNEELNWLEEDDALLAVIHFIFNRDAASFDEIDEVYVKAGGRGAIANKLATNFGDRHISVDRRAQKVFRRSRTVRVPRTPRGLEFKNGFTHKEIAKSFGMEPTTHLSPSLGTMQYSAIVPIHKDRFEEIERDGVARLISLIGATRETLEDKDVSPFFVSVILSSRPDYDVK